MAKQKQNQDPLKALYNYANSIKDLDGYIEEDFKSFRKNLNDDKLENYRKIMEADKNIAPPSSLGEFKNMLGYKKKTSSQKPSVTYEESVSEPQSTSDEITPGQEQADITEGLGEPTEGAPKSSILHNYEEASRRFWNLQTKKGKTFRNPLSVR